MQRVFSSKELDCQCSLKSASLEPQSVEVEQISKNKGLLRIEHEFDPDSVVDVHVSFNGGASLWLIGRVAESGERGLFLKWMHSSEHAEARLQTALVENADRVASEAAGDNATGSSTPTRSGTPSKSPFPKNAKVAKHTPQQRPKKSAKSGRKAQRDSGATSTRQNHGKPVASIAAPQRPQPRPIPIPPGGARPAAASAATVAAPPPADGKYDVGAEILRHAKTVESADLAANMKQVQVLDMGTITRFIMKAVEEAQQSLETKLTEEQHQQLLEEAEEKFNERLEEFKAQNAGLETRAELLQKQLVDAQSLLEEERQRVVSADQFTVSDTGIGELEGRLESILERALVKHAAPESIQEEMRELVSHVLDQERERAKEKEQEAQSDAVSLLERKVSRLASALDETETARARAEKRASILEQHAGSGVANAMLAGLDDDDPDKDQKLALLKSLHDANREVREHINATKPDGPDKGGLFKSMAASGSLTMQVKKITVPEQAPPPMTKNSADSESGGKEERVDV